ncbi:MAG: (2Fe-2S)-binding protein [Burkholderiaceae bacterium]|jgi:aerobic carbon-monoxide dehydrogenase small subunit|nr:(2Fe-2S)-binding protein [Burkholderiaceae bacterium]
MATLHTIAMTVNGQTYEGKLEARVTLADFLRHYCDLTGTHVGCEHGVCGACTIHVDGRAVRSCTMYAVQADGSTVKTVEGLARDDQQMHPVQEAFREFNGLQCGFCTPGMQMTIAAYLEENANPSERELRELISGNICRCTGYQGIVKAGLRAAERLREEQN